LPIGGRSEADAEWQAAILLLGAMATGATDEADVAIVVPLTGLGWEQGDGHPIDRFTVAHLVRVVAEGWLWSRSRRTSRSSRQRTSTRHCCMRLKPPCRRVSRYASRVRLLLDKNLSFLLCETLDAHGPPPRWHTSRHWCEASGSLRMVASSPART
jgi:hypothetical protein